MFDSLWRHHSRGSNCSLVCRKPDSISGSNIGFLNPWSKCEFLKESRACEKDCYKFGTDDCREKCETKHDCISCMDEQAKYISNCPCHSGCPDGCPCRHWPCDDDETHDDSQLLILDTKNRQSFLFRRGFNLMPR